LRRPFLLGKERSMADAFVCGLRRKLVRSVWKLDLSRRKRGLEAVWKLYDISMDIHPAMRVWKDKDDKRPVFETVSTHAQGKSHETRLRLDAHTGTHVDAPLHMIAGGATIDAIPLEKWMGPARVLDLTGVRDSIGRAELEPHAPQRGEWILLKTRNSFAEGGAFDYGFVFLNAEAAAYLKEAGVRGVGIDALGVERDQPGYPTHRTLLEAGILIAEGLCLKDVPVGSYWLIIAPLRLIGVEAAPARAFLIGAGDGNGR